MKVANNLTEEKPKLLIVSDRIAPFFIGGYETTLQRLSNLLQTDFDVFWLTSFNQKPDVSFKEESNSMLLMEDKIHVIPIGNNLVFTNRVNVHSLRGVISYNLHVRKTHISDLKFDFVIINSIPYIGITRLLKRFLDNSKNVSVIFYEAWYNYPEGLSMFLFRIMLRASIKNIIRSSKFIIAISKATKASLIDNYGVPENKIWLVPLGIDLISHGVNKAYNNSDYEITILYLGRLSKIKRIPDIIDAVAVLKKKGRFVKAVIAGDGPLLKFLRKYARDKGVMDSIEFTGYLVNEEKDRIYKHSKIFIMPSEREGFSIATLEAMAYAVVPVVAEPKFKELFGIGQYLKDGYNGFTYPVGKLEQLVQVIERLIDNRTLFEMLSKNAQDTSSCYTWEKSANLLTEFIRGVL